MGKQKSQKSVGEELSYGSGPDLGSLDLSHLPQGSKNLTGSSSRKSAFQTMSASVGAVGSASRKTASGAMGRMTAYFAGKVGDGDEDG